MILTGSQIKSRLNKNKQEYDKQKFDNKLVVTPILSIEDQIKDDAVSIDLRLGTNFVISNRFIISHTDPRRSEYNSRDSLMNYEVRIGDELVLHPNQFMLGETLEWIKMPNDLAGLVTAKSSEARDGLQIESANLIHPRFSGTITLELKNNGEIPILLFPGLTIGQISFICLENPIEEITTIAKSSFQPSVTPWVSTKSKKDLEILKRVKGSY